MRFCFYLLILLLSACSSFDFDSVREEAKALSEEKTKTSSCSMEWFKYVESQVLSQDQQGHGPDIGSEEWQSVIEFKLGLDKVANKPDKLSPEWCKFIQQALDDQRFETSFSCAKPKLQPIEKIICSHSEMAALDRKMSEVYKLAFAKAAPKELKTLKTEQIGWIKGRNACWKADNKDACILETYSYRIAFLQARYQLIETLGPIYYVCDERPTDEISVMFYATKPPGLIAELSGETSFMLLQNADNGTKYQGRNESFREFEGKAQIIWGYETVAMTCEKMH